jgi:hypothetical protein
VVLYVFEVPKIAGAKVVGTAKRTTRRLMNLEEADKNGDQNELYQSFSVRAQGTNIDPVTLLATDYLNHFNEIVMLLELIPDMPDCLEDALAWQPKSYQQHFAESQFSDKLLAIEAFDHVPHRFRQPFDAVIRQMDSLVPRALHRIGALLSTEDDERLRQVCTECSRRLQKMIDVASAIIHGSAHPLDQTEIDHFLAD